MNQLLCHICASHAGYLISGSIGNLTQSQYQLDKFIKHTLPTASYQLNSTFRSSEYNQYRNYVVEANKSGCVEIDDRERRNIIYVAHEPVGYTDVYGTRIHCNCVKVVCPHDPGKMHAYPTSSMQLSTASCSNCGEALIK